MTRTAVLFGVLALMTCVVVEAQAGARAPAATFASDRLTVTTRGTGPDIILIPGLASHRDVWREAAGRLESRYRLHLIQVKGFAGLAAGRNAEGNVSAPVAEEIARYIRERRLARPAVIGHSMGGSIGMMLAARHPDLVGRLMVVDMPPYMGDIFGGPGATAESVRAAADQMRDRILAEPPDAPTSMLAQMFSTMARSDAHKAELQKYARDSDRRTVANAFHELIVTDLRPELTRITAPVTVLFVVPPKAPMPPDQFESTMRATFANVRGVELKRIDDSLHFIQLDQPERFASEVDAFMRR